MSSYDSRFERELKKRIAAEAERLLEELVAGVAVTDYAKYQNYVGRLASLRRITEEFCPEIQTIIDKG